MCFLQKRAHEENIDQAWEFFRENKIEKALELLKEAKTQKEAAVITDPFAKISYKTGKSKEEDLNGNGI